MGGITGEIVAVLKKHCTYQFVSWLGFATKAMAVEMKGVPVKIKVNRIGHKKNGGTRWEEVPPGKHVQGCLVDAGCYCVLTSGVRLV